MNSDFIESIKRTTNQLNWVRDYTHLKYKGYKSSFNKEIVLRKDQKNLIDFINNGDDHPVMIRAERQSGLTTILMMQACEFAYSNAGASIVIGTSKGTMTSYFVDMIRHQSPFVLKRHNRVEVEFENFSKIKFVNLNAHSINFKGQKIDLAIVDLASFISNKNLQEFTEFMVSYNPDAQLIYGTSEEVINRDTYFDYLYHRMDKTRNYYLRREMF